MLWRIAALAAGFAGFACSGPAVLADVPYDTRFGDAATMDIYIPDGPAPAAGRPAVMLIHGGAWRFGSKDDYDAAAERLARAGFVAATINYRLVPAGILPGRRAGLPVRALLSARQRRHVRHRSGPYRRLRLLGGRPPLVAHRRRCRAAGPRARREWGPTGPPAASHPGSLTSHTMLDSQNDLVSSISHGRPRGEGLRDLRHRLTHRAGPPGAPPYPDHPRKDDVVEVEGAIAMVDALRAGRQPGSFLELRGAGRVVTRAPTRARSPSRPRPTCQRRGRDHRLPRPHPWERPEAADAPPLPTRRSSSLPHPDAPRLRLRRRAQHRRRAPHTANELRAADGPHTADRQAGLPRAGPPYRRLDRRARDPPTTASRARIERDLVAQSSRWPSAPASVRGDGRPRPSPSAAAPGFADGPRADARLVPPPSARGRTHLHRAGDRGPHDRRPPHHVAGPVGWLNFSPTARLGCHPSIGGAVIREAGLDAAPHRPPAPRRHRPHRRLALEMG